MTEFSKKILEVAEEGAVLLRNNENALPLIAGDKVSIFGRCQIDYYKSGTGSGGSVHVPYTTNLTDELKALSKEVNIALDTETENIYRAWIKENPFDTGGGAWAAEPWFQADMGISPQIAQKAAKFSNKAIYVIGRTAGEDKDYGEAEGAWYLTKTERQNLIELTKTFETVIVILNVSSIIDTAWINDEIFSGHIKAVLYSWHGGEEGGRAAARLLCALGTPSGKLSDTIAQSIKDYPSYENFGNLKKNIYKEDIYVGYRYFNTFAPDAILFPFGYGLSYTTFKTDAFASITGNGVDSIVHIKATVQNTGEKYAGKEVVQIYAETPQGTLGKPSRTLVAFAKTKLLSPKETCTLDMTFPLRTVASYDDRGSTGAKYCFVLEKGEYKIYAGSDVSSCSPILIDSKEAFALKENIVVERLEQAAAPTEAFKRLKPGKKQNGIYTKEYEDVPLNAVNMGERIKENLPKEMQKGTREISFEDVKKDGSLLDEFVALLSKEELATLVRGEGMLSQKVTQGIAAAYGGLSQALYKRGVPCAGCSDGPSGIRMDTGEIANLMPIGTLIACTWNLDLVEKLYEQEGHELAQNQIDSLLGPGMNIHRFPLNGRNFEYFSEDPLLTGLMVAAELKGLRVEGSCGTIKHYALNSQEAERTKTDSIASERAIREIYLRAFEIAVKEGKATSIMTSYNAINGHWAASNYDTVNTILRKEWGYAGLVMTDWWAKMNDCAKGGEADYKNLSYMVRAGNDIYMVVPNNEAETYKDTINSSLEDGSLTLGELQLCAKRVLNFVLHAPVSKRPLRPLAICKEYASSQKEAPDGAKTIFEGEAITASLLNETDAVYFIAKEKKSFNVVAQYRKEEATVSQSVCNVLLDGQTVASIECRTTEGRTLIATPAQIILEPGAYRLSIEHTKAGIELIDIKFC